MGYRKFSTKNAEYLLVFNNHLTEFHPSNINESRLDALVLESSNIKGKCPIAIEFSCLKRWLEKGVPIYLVDPDVNAGGMLLLENYFDKAVNPLGEDENNGILDGVHDAIDKLPPTPLIELRNAVCARKLEEFVAPRLKSRHPSIALVFGGHHSGLEQNLKHKDIRDAVLSLYRQAGYLGLDKDTMDKVHEIYPKSKRHIIHHPNLF